VSGDALEERRDSVSINSAPPRGFSVAGYLGAAFLLPDLTTSRDLRVIPRMRGLDCPRREIFRFFLLAILLASQVLHPILSRLFPRSHEYALAIARYRQVGSVDGRVVVSVIVSARHRRDSPRARRHRLITLRFGESVLHGREQTRTAARDPDALSARERWYPNARFDRGPCLMSLGGTASLSRWSAIAICPTLVLPLAALTFALPQIVQGLKIRESRISNLDKRRIDRLLCFRFDSPLRSLPGFAPSLSLARAHYTGGLVFRDCSRQERNWANVGRAKSGLTIA